MRTNLGAALPAFAARALRRARALIATTTLMSLMPNGAGVVLMSGCTLDPPGPSPIYSRLPADQAGATATQPQAGPALTPEQLRRYDEIDQQALAESDRAATAEAAAQAWSRAYTPPVNVYGSYYSGGWGSGWGTGIGYGYPGWGW